MKDHQMANSDDITVTVGSIREMTTVEKAERDRSADKPSNYSRDPKEAHADAVAISKLAEDSKAFSTEGIAMPVLGQQEETVETVTTKTERPKATIKGEPEELVAVSLLMDWRDGQGVLHQFGKKIDLPANEALKLLGERRAERVDPPKDTENDRAKAEAKSELDKAEKRAAHSAAKK